MVLHRPVPPIDAVVYMYIVIFNTFRLVCWLYKLLWDVKYLSRKSYSWFLRKRCFFSQCQIFLGLWNEQKWSCSTWGCSVTIKMWCSFLVHVSFCSGRICWKCNSPFVKKLAFYDSVFLIALCYEIILCGYWLGMKETYLLDWIQIIHEAAGRRQQFVLESDECIVKIKKYWAIKIGFSLSYLIECCNK